MERTILVYDAFTDEMFKGNPEEAATGTSNGALIYYLYLNKKIELEEKIEIVQGETIGRKSKILGQLILENGRVEVLIGGKAVKFIEGKIDI